jgi:hypothetical protein
LHSFTWQNLYTTKPETLNPEHLHTARGQGALVDIGVDVVVVQGNDDNDDNANVGGAGTDKGTKTLTFDNILPVLARAQAGAGVGSHMHHIADSPHHR